MLSYVNNKFCSLNEAKISVNDRGYQFGDAVYEVIFYKNGKFLDLEGHLKRLRTSMFRIDFELKFSDSAIITIIKRLVTANDIKNGSIYIQVSRGEYSRDHSYFNMPLKPILVIITKKIKINCNKYLLKKMKILFFLKYLIISFTSSSFKFDKCDLIWIFKYLAASSISFDFLFNFFANSNTFIFICFVDRYLQDIILIFQVLKRLFQIQNEHKSKYNSDWIQIFRTH